MSLKAEDLFSMKGKHCLVTGGSIGIGRMISEGLCANGATVYICSRKKDACEKTAKELNEKYPQGKAISKPGDLSSIQGVEKLVASLSDVEKIHVLINNAGATWGATLEEYPDEAWQKIMDLNVRHVFNLTKLLIPKLAKAAVQGDPARVINIASTDGVRASQSYGPTAAFAYTTSKGAVIHLSKTLCRALSPYNISVNVVAPGVFPSKMTKFMYENESIKNSLEQTNPLKRNGTTEDMAGTILYLVSRAGAWTNGTIVVLDGGMHLHDIGMQTSKRFIANCMKMFNPAALLADDTTKVRAADLLDLQAGAGPAKRYWDKTHYATFEDQLAALRDSTTVYVGNLSYYTSEQHVYEMARQVGPIRRVIMGLHREKKTPCGFAFVEFFSRKSLLDAETILNGKTLEGRVLKFEADPGFKEGRQFGRGRGGGQVRDDFREEDDPERGGVGSLAQVGLLPNRKEGGLLPATDRPSRFEPAAPHNPSAGGGVPPPLLMNERSRGQDEDRMQVKRGRFDEESRFRGGDRGGRFGGDRGGRGRNRSRDNRRFGGPHQGRRHFPPSGHAHHHSPQQHNKDKPLVDEFGRDINPQRE